MKTLKKYISVIAVSTAGFAVDVLKKYVGGISIISAWLAWTSMLLLTVPLPHPEHSNSFLPSFEKMWAVFSVIAVVSGFYAITRGKKRSSRLEGYLAIFAMFPMLCICLWLALIFFVK